MTPAAPARPSGLPTRQAAILLALVAFLTLVLSPTVHAYYKERAQTEALAAEVEQRRADVARLERERAAWNDPAFVEQKARERLRFVRPGERTYVVVGKDEVTRAVPEQAKTPSGVAAPKNDDAPWYGELWESTRIAAQGPAGGARPGAPSAPPRPGGVSIHPSTSPSSGGQP